MSDKLVPVVIDLTITKQQKLNESFLRMFGGAVKWILKGMFGEKSPIKEENQENSSAPFQVKGTEKEVDSFVKALVGEKQYIENYLEYGITNKKTREKKYRLDDAIENFEKTTGLIWPIK